jgi:hypothetical protein
MTFWSLVVLGVIGLIGLVALIPRWRKHVGHGQHDDVPNLDG